MKKVFFLLILGIITCCTDNETLKISQDYLELDDGKIWYEVIGNKDETPIVLLHGEPGYPSYYLNPLKDLGKNRPITNLVKILKNHDRTMDAEKIKVPTLYITGKLDSARPRTVRHHQSLTPN